MTDSEFRLIKSMLEKDIVNNDIDSLRKIRSYLTEQINICLKRTDTENYDVLTYDIRDFLDEYIDKNIKFRKGPLYRGIRKTLKKTQDDEIIIAEILGMGKNTLEKEKGIGEYTINLFEKILNSLGYSLDEELTLEQLMILRDLQQEKFNIKKYCKTKKEDTN
ncbi:MAG: helix-turn-helix transcriptional regulator [Firmicutes bacterium]|nr:helix-turn-helix transcriptional regulator [Bacillota bacterium]